MSQDFDWKAAVSGIAPTIASCFGTPLLGAGVALLCKELLGTSSTDQATNEASLNTTLQAGLTPEQKTAIATADSNMKAALIAADIRKTEIAADTEKSYLADVMDARAHNANTVGILHLGYMVYAFSYLCVVATLVGCYMLISKSDALKGIDPGALVALGGIVGGALQWIYSNANQVSSFFYGSSPTSRQQAQQMADSVTATVKASARKDASK